MHSPLPVIFLFSTMLVLITAENKMAAAASS